MTDEEDEENNKEEDNSISLKEMKQRIYDALKPMDQLAGVDETGENVPHPLHGSDTGNNFEVDGQQWFCFRNGHNSGGSKFEWVAMEEGILNCADCTEGALRGKDFIDTLEIAAERAGVDFKVSRDKGRQFEEKSKEMKKLEEIIEFAVGYFNKQLENNSDGINVKKRLKEYRGFTEDTIDKYKIGYAPNDMEFMKRVINKYGKERAKKAGLLKKNNKPYFKGQIIFPYIKNGKFRYLIGRKTEHTPDYVNGKYIKLPNSDKEHISDYLEEPIFGIDSIRGADKVIVTEGITDAISLLQELPDKYGVISPVTTQFSKEKIKILKNIVRSMEEVYVVMDNEENESGLEGALNVLTSIKEEYNDKKVFFVELPRDPDRNEKVDVNDYLTNHNGEDFLELLEDAEWKWDAIARYRGNIKDHFEAAIRDNSHDPERLVQRYDREEHEYVVEGGIEDIIESVNGIKQLSTTFLSDSNVRKMTPEALGSRSKIRVLGDALGRHMNHDGKFLEDKENEKLYYYAEDKHEVFRVDVEKSSDFDEHLEGKYGLSKGFSEDMSVIEKIKEYGRREAEEVDIHDMFYYDKDKNILYIYNRENSYYKLDGETIEKVPNGLQGVFFRQGKVEGEIEYIEPENREDFEIKGQKEMFKGQGNNFEQALVNRVNYTQKGALTKEQQRLQMLIQLYQIPFYSEMETRPILTIVGPRGSGKTIALEWIGQFLISPEFTVGKESNKENFVVSVSNRLYYVMDNLDKTPEWLYDILASVSTGVELSKRSLYTEFDEAVRKPDCFVGITTRNPEFNRDDLVDRMLIFYADRFDKNIFKKHLYEPLEKPEYYNVLWSDFMDDLNAILTEIDGDFMDIMSGESKLRTAGWDNFSKPIAKVKNINEEDRAVLIDDMEKTRSMFALRNDPLKDALVEWENDGFIDPRGDGSSNDWYFTEDLHDIFTEYSNEVVGEYQNPISLGKRLSNIEEHLRELYNIEVKRDSKKNKKKYKFEAVPSKFNENTSVAQSDDSDEDDSSSDTKIANF